MATLRRWIRLASEKGRNLAASVRPYASWLYAVPVLIGLWILLRTYQADNLGFASRTLWDWLELLVVPLALALAGFWFSRIQKRTELEIAEKARESDREIAQQARKADRKATHERQDQLTLEKYLDRMKELLLDRNLGPDAKPEVKNLARAWTLNVLRELTAGRNRQVIQFLQESKLLGLESVVDLQEADLSGVDLSGANLSGANLRRANLNNANLQEANLARADLSEVNLRQANLSRTLLWKADLQQADLQEANLSDAHVNEANLEDAVLGWANLYFTSLREANLQNATLVEANLSYTNLWETDLTGAYLGGATGVRDSQLAEALLSDSTWMPDKRRYLEWKQERASEQQVAEVAEPNSGGTAPPDVRARLIEPDPGEIFPPNETAESGGYTQADAAG
jgi:uncharacterized protein YjbI with pentapeptide repeats